MNDPEEHVKLSTTRRPARAVVSAVRGLRLLNVIVVTIAIVIGGAGFASAATGGTFILGRSNNETSTARLFDSDGIPLSLSAPKDRAPLAVNRSTMVTNLNAQYVGGLTASALGTSGSDTFTTPGTDTAVPSDADGESSTVVLRTAKLPKGTYYVTETALLHLAYGDTGGFCDVLLSGQAWQARGESQGTSWMQSAATVVVQVTTPDSLVLQCGTIGSVSGSYADDASLTVVRS
jgi:hypothetical protein